MTKHDDKENNNKYWHCNWRIKFKLKKKHVTVSLISTVIFALLFTWLYLMPLYIYRHEFNDKRGNAIAFAINAALGVLNKEYYSEKFLTQLNMRLKKIDISEEELDSLACVRRLNEHAREQCQYVDHKPTQTHYNGEHGRWPCLETDLMTLRECLRVEANPWLSDNEVELFTNREILDKYPHLLKIIEPIFVRPCDYIPTPEEVEKLQDKYEAIDFRQRRSALRCDEKIEVKDREDIHLWLGGYGLKGKPASIKLTVRRRD